MSERELVADPWAVLRRATRARIGLGRAGCGLPTRPLLDFQEAHALARDAVHAPFDAAAMVAAAGVATGGQVFQVCSRAADRAVYLQRPDLGRLVDGDDLARLPPGDYDAAFVIADGLSAAAVHAHAVPVLRETLARLPAAWRIAPVVVARQARVALGDAIGERLGATLVAVLIGERPGLSSPDSLGIYLTFAPRPGRVDSERNCISNIRPPDGLDYAAAAGQLAALMRAARRLGATGVGLKITEQPPLVPALSPG